MITTQGYGSPQIAIWGFGDPTVRGGAVAPVVLSQGYWGYRNWGTFLWADGSTTNMGFESVPSETLTLDGIPSTPLLGVEGLPSGTFAQDGIPGKGTAQYGAYVGDGYGAWTEPPAYGAYTAPDAYETEMSPINTFTPEGRPVT